MKPFCGNFSVYPRFERSICADLKRVSDETLK